MRGTMQATIRPMTREDKSAVTSILQNTPEFTPGEAIVAEELIDCYLDDPANSGYSVLVAQIDSQVEGYICYGPTPLTTGTWDIYWIAVAPKGRGQGLGQALLSKVEAAINGQCGRLVLVETSSKPNYERTRHFYELQGYKGVERIPDFYAPGDDRITLQKRLR